MWQPNNNIYQSTIDVDSLGSCTTLYIGNLDRRIDEQTIMEIFGLFFPTQIISCRFFPDLNSNNEQYCFMTFSDVTSATSALSIMNGREMLGKKIKVNWAAGNQSKPVVSGVSFSVYVGDLPHDCDDAILANAFRPYGEVLSSRVVRDMDSGLSKGFGFVVYRHQHEAEEAINKMHGGTICDKTVKVSWATRSKTMVIPSLNYGEVYGQSSGNNTTIYVGNLPDGITEQLLESYFEPYGSVVEKKILHDRKIGFLKMDTHEAAATAIVKCNGLRIEGSMIKVWWSRDTPQLPTGALSSMGSIPGTTPSGPTYAPPMSSYEQQQQQQQQPSQRGGYYNKNQDYNYQDPYYQGYNPNSRNYGGYGY